MSDLFDIDWLGMAKKKPQHWGWILETQKYSDDYENKPKAPLIPVPMENNNNDIAVVTQAQQPPPPPPATINNIQQPPPPPQNNLPVITTGNEIQAKVEKYKKLGIPREGIINKIAREDGIAAEIVEGMLDSNISNNTTFQPAPPPAPAPAPTNTNVTFEPPPKPTGRAGLLSQLKAGKKLKSHKPKVGDTPPETNILSQLQTKMQAQKKQSNQSIEEKLAQSKKTYNAKAAKDLQEKLRKGEPLTAKQQQDMTVIDNMEARRQYFTDSDDDSAESWGSEKA